MSNILDLSMDQGSTFVRIFNIKNDANAAFNLTGFDARLQVRRTYGDTTTLINATLSNGKLALTNAVGGVLTLTLVPSDTSAIRFGTVNADVLEAVYDLEIQSAIGEVTKLVRGSATFNREITR